MDITINRGQPIGSPSGSSRLGPGCAIAFFGSFFLFGCVALVGIVLGAILPEWRANFRYLPNTCVVLDKKVARKDEGESGPMYRPEIQIRYEVGGRNYEVWTYNAVNAFSSGHRGKEAIIDRYKVGAKYPCWYDPNRPDKAVLVRGYTWLPYVMLILPAVFLPVGGFGIYYSWKNRGKTARQLAEESPLRVGGVVMRADPDRPTVPTLDLSQGPGDTLKYRLTSGNPPGRTLIGALFFAVFWNGITAPVVVMIIASHFGWDGMDGSPRWLITLFITPFALIGVWLIARAVKQSLVTFGVGPTTVEVSDHSLLPGGCYDVFVSQSGRLTMNSLRVLWVCEEEAKYRLGTNTRTETRRVFEEEILTSEGFEVQEGIPFEARGELRVPPRSMHSFVSANNQVRWKVVVRGDVAGWPDFEREYPIVVLPSPGVAT